MRNIIKNLFYSLAFIVGLIALLLVVSQIVTPKNNSAKDGIQDPIANGILGEGKNTIDVLVLGDSEAYCAFIPLKIWQDYGITSYVCATSSQKLCYSEEFLHKAFRNQSPKVVILETDAIFRDLRYNDVIAQKAERAFSVFQYHNRWKTLQSKDWTFTVNYTHVVNSKGYVYNTAVVEATVDGYMKASNEKVPISSKNIGYVENIRDFCYNNGAKLILISTPSTLNWNSMRHNSIQELSEKLGVEYLDMNLMHEKISIDWKKDTHDRGDHMNHYGAMKVTSYVGKYLSESGLFTDRRQDKQYGYWNTMVEEFNKATSNALK